MIKKQYLIYLKEIGKNASNIDLKSKDYEKQLKEIKERNE